MPGQAAAPRSTGLNPAAGALFHTQAGLVGDPQARVLKPDGTPLANVFGGGGAARGLFGPSGWGYSSRAGLLTATALGRAAWTSAAACIIRE